MSAEQKVSWSDSFSQAQTAIQSLSTILSSIPPHLSSSDNPSLALLTDPDLATQISNHLRQPDSGAGDNQLCRWLYDTFHTSKIDLQLVVLRFLPIIAGIYLSRIHLRKPLAGFEAVLLAIYAHETTARNGQAITMNLPDLSHPSIYHESKQQPHKQMSTDLNLVVISPGLDPQGTIRSTKRARIIGVGLELYHSKIVNMPVQSKLDFCEFCIIWAGQDGQIYKNFPNDSQIEKGKEDERNEKQEGRILLPWEMLQPILRILSHCLMGTFKNKNDNKNIELHEAACRACRSLYARALHDINPKAILAIGSLLKLINFRKTGVDHTELPVTYVINL